MKVATTHKDYFRINRTRQDVRISVKKIVLDGLSTPVSKWVVVRELPGDAPKSMVDESVEELLKDPRYFGTCAKCGKLVLRGQMDDKGVCNGCATPQSVGVVILRTKSPSVK